MQLLVHNLNSMPNLYNDLYVEQNGRHVSDYVFFNTLLGERLFVFWLTFIKIYS